MLEAFFDAFHSVSALISPIRLGSSFGELILAGCCHSRQSAAVRESNGYFRLFREIKHEAVSEIAGNRHLSAA